MSDNEANMIL